MKYCKLWVLQNSKAKSGPSQTTKMELITPILRSP